MAKKILALVAAVVLLVCFSVAVSAATVSTTTEYLNNKADVNVTVKVTGVAEGTNVTYYATKGNEKVYIDQQKATSTGATFNFKTAATNIGSAVKVGYTNVATADGETIPVPQYKVSGEGFTATAVDAGELSVVLEGYTFGTNKELGSVTLISGTAVISGWSYADGKITVMFSALDSDVVLQVNEVDAKIDDTTIEFDIVDAAAVVAKDDENVTIKDNDGNVVEDQDVIESVTANEGNRKLTVCGKVVGEVAEYGIIVSEDEIDEESLRADAFNEKYADKKYQAATKASDGKFAVQLIDTSVVGEEGTPFVEANVDYHTAVYVYDATTDAYYVAPYATTVTAATVSAN